MARPTIVTTDPAATLTFIKTEGVIFDQQDQIVMIDRPGINGVAGYRRGKKAPPSAIVGIIDVDNAGGVDTLRTTLRSLAGATATYTDHDGNSTANLIVESAQQINAAQRIESPVNPNVSNAQYLVRVQVILRATDIS